MSLCQQYSCSWRQVCSQATPSAGGWFAASAGTGASLGTPRSHALIVSGCCLLPSIRPPRLLRSHGDKVRPVDRVTYCHMHSLLRQCTAHGSSCRRDLGGSTPCHPALNSLVHVVMYYQHGARYWSLCRQYAREGACRQASALWTSTGRTCGCSQQLQYITWLHWSTTRFPGRLFLLMASCLSSDTGPPCWFTNSAVACDAFCGHVTWTVAPKRTGVPWLAQVITANRQASTARIWTLLNVQAQHWIVWYQGLVKGHVASELFSWDTKHQNRLHVRTWVHGCHLEEGMLRDRLQQGVRSVWARAGDRIQHQDCHHGVHVRPPWRACTSSDLYTVQYAHSCCTITAVKVRPRKAAHCVTLEC